ncbi:GrpB domain, predicted nucleotidyltransferase, UPF0157 family [Microbacterium saccharophilum]|uniref:GrpB domain, predicted nucleotidyltransferase, UPF0157 family n=2 Tax=Microbacteriaceae TaxID=85023 RepID=A0A7Z7CVX5_9MICO|nr:GrpB domain, predicted nucleotidyltransferase, UPF0157 family [Microbacterium saccharophilum]
MFVTDAASVSRAHAIAATVRERLAAHAVPGELTLTGGSSLPGLLTKGDIDLHLRVRAGQFESAVERLRAVAGAVHPEIWTRTFATFERTDEPAVGIAVTVLGCEHDLRFTRGWARLAEDPDARDEYNALKRAEEYEDAKSQFFDRISRPGWDAAEPAP